MPLPAGGTRTGISSSSFSSGASASGGGATRGGAATGTCSRKATATTCCIALSKASDSSSVEVSEEVLRRGGSATGSITSEGEVQEGGQQGWSLSLQGAGVLLLSPTRLECRWGVLSPFVYLLSS
ncbi:UNVERIFIED_CONTAM: hypothetical protein Slati_3085300 [Sesamum latifolium]|uniref:Uncharacterized protein n=1 Tax=Sesamum latifolium TaxID=2727402 RepID=A0AAW2UTS3_9LAMI